jgi:hypothetical protein
LHVPIHVEDKVVDFKIEAQNSVEKRLGRIGGKIERDWITGLKICLHKKIKF